MDFIEFAAVEAGSLDSYFSRLGFIEIAKVPNKNIKLFRQGDINFISNGEPHTYAAQFAEAHGPSVVAMGFRVGDAAKAFQSAVERGARPYDGNETSRGATPYPAIYGVGESLIYFIDESHHKDLYEKHFQLRDNSVRPMGSGLQSIEHLTYNVPATELPKWSEFYQKIFNFREVRFFDIKGQSTGLVSKVMRSPCLQFSVPITAPTHEKSQIQEYLNQYKGPGIQHIALVTDNILPSLEKLKSNHIDFVNTPTHDYYASLPQRLPLVKEDLARLEKNSILVDGDSEGYLLQIFTKNSIGPIFFEVVQRKGHDGFGDRNFQALFDAVEAGQRERGYL